MSRNPLALAAIASVAVPGLDVYDVLRSPHADADVDVIVVVDATGKRWTVRAPREAAVGAGLEAELGLLAALGRAADSGAISFQVPRPAGSAALADGGRAFVYEQIRGARLSLAALEPGPGLAAGLGRAIAQMHELPPSIVEDQGLPGYTAEAYRQRRLAELDAAIQTGRVPPMLADRWERQLENVAWWRFEPVVTHGGLAEHQFLVAQDAIVGLVGWGDAKVADPADDFAWLIAAAEPDIVDTVVEAYSVTRREVRDPHLLDRAGLASELALARWLLHGARTDSEAIVEDAVGMLADLVTLLESQD